MNDRVRAKDLLNEQRYEEAATLLERMHGEAPADGEVAVLLASAYAGSVGFSVIDLYTAFEPLFAAGSSSSQSKGAALVELTSNATVEPAEPPTLSPAAALHILERDTIKFLKDLSNGLTTLSRLPHTPLEQRKRLVQARFVLEDVGADDPFLARSKLYTALLDALQATNYLRDAMGDAAATAEDSFLGIVCSTNFVLFFENIGPATDYLLASTQNLNESYALRDLPPPKALAGLSAQAARVRTTFDANRDQISDADLSLATARQQYCD